MWLQHTEVIFYDGRCGERMSVFGLFKTNICRACCTVDDWLTDWLTELVRVWMCVHTSSGMKLSSNKVNNQRLILVLLKHWVWLLPPPLVHTFMCVCVCTSVSNCPCTSAHVWGPAACELWNKTSRRVVWRCPEACHDFEVLQSGEIRPGRLFPSGTGQVLYR